MSLFADMEIIGTLTSSLGKVRCLLALYSAPPQALLASDIVLQKCRSLANLG
jgi:hypothetical protein